MDNIPKSTKKKRHYCSICSNFRGKLVDGQSIVLHRFPVKESLRKLWVKRVKTVMKNFAMNDSHSRVCSAHFENGRMCRGNDIPSIFKMNSRTKLFGTRTASPVIPPIATEAIWTVPTETAVTEEYNDIGEITGDWTDLMDALHESEDLVVEDRVCFVATKFENEPSVSMAVTVNTAEENVSAMMHDYCGYVNPETINDFNPSECSKMQQTELCSELLTRSMSDSATQTLRKRTTSTMSGTESTAVKTKEVGIQCCMPDLTFFDIADDNSKVMLYTGLPNSAAFYSLFDEMDDADAQTSRSGFGTRKGRPRKLTLIDEFFVVLMRLRLGLLMEDLAQRFRVSKTTCSTIVNIWIEYLHVKLSVLSTWPTREIIDLTMPRKFKEKYPKTRVILDCTEFFTETPQSLINKSLLYSHYKSHMTYKVLLGISPSGLITFVSDLWNGAISDKQITRSSGILDLCERGDAIMADKGFLIADLTTPRGIQLIIPPFKTQRFTRRQVEETRRIANLRIYVEMAMERVKNFRILQGVIPITLTSNLTKTLHICAGLSNMQPPLVLDHD